MKPIIVLLFFVLSLNAFSQSAYRKESEIRESPQDILEYYLIIPGEPYNMALSGDPDDLTEFEFRKLYLRPMPDMTVIIDKKNAFMSITDNTSELSYHMQITYFTQSDGNRIIAIYEDQAKGDCASKSLHFYKYVHKKFIDVTAGMIPEITLSDFCPAASDPQYNIFDLAYDLPRVGTIIKVTANPVCEQDKRINMRGDKYADYFKKLSCHSLQLTWNKKAGNFLLKKS